MANLRGAIKLGLKTAGVGDRLLSRQAAADRVGVSRTHLCNFLNGKASLNIVALEKLMDVAGVVCYTRPVSDDEPAKG